MGADDEDRLRILQLIDEEATARAAINPAHQATLRAWWRCVSDLLFAHARLTGVERRPPLPGDLVMILGELAGELAVGTVSPVIADSVSRGANAPVPEERRAHLFAVAYRRACKPEGLMHCGEVILIDDPYPTKTLAGWYGMSPRTLQEWFRAEHDLSPLGALTPEILTSHTVAAGARMRAVRTRLGGGSRPHRLGRSRNGHSVAR